VGKLNEKLALSHDQGHDLRTPRWCTASEAPKPTGWALPCYISM